MDIFVKKHAGLDAVIDSSTATLIFREPVTVEKESVRIWTEMKTYAAESTAMPSRNDIYHVYRNIARPPDRKRIAVAGIRYDITVMPSGFFSGAKKEFFRTAGHYHPLKPGTDLAYPEIFEVLAGRAYFTMQKPFANDSAVLEEIYAVEAGPGEKVIMPPGFGHLSVNSSSETLILGNWVADSFSYDYKSYENMHGAGYWVNEGFIEGTIEFEKNHHYQEVPELKKLRPKELPEFGVLWKMPLYMLAESLEKLSFLTHPEDFREKLAVSRCFRSV